MSFVGANHGPFPRGGLTPRKHVGCQVKQDDLLYRFNISAVNRVVCELGEIGDHWNVKKENSKIGTVSRHNVTTQRHNTTPCCTRQRHGPSLCYVVERLVKQKVTINNEYKTTIGQFNEEFEKLKVKELMKKESLLVVISFGATTFGCRDTISR